MGFERVKNRSVAAAWCTLAAACVLTGPLAAQPSAAPSAPAVVAEPEIREALAQARGLSRAFQYAARRVEPSVVHIESQSKVGGVAYDFFGRAYRQPEGFRPSGLGSGVIVSQDGYILTNNHVVAGADRLNVKLSDGRTYQARAVGTDAATDVAVLKVDASGLTPAEFGDSDALEVGEWVVAIGSPFGFDNTVTAGILSAKGRALNPLDYGKYEDFLQTDAAINPGNSGGPLLTLEGKVIGINTAIASRGGGSVGIGFAIPSTIARSVMDTLVRTGRVERGWLGINMSELTPELARALRYAGQGGVVVGQVIPASPAERAGLRQNDIAVKFNGREVDDLRELSTAIALASPGTSAELEVVRDGSPVTLTVEVGDRSLTLGLAVDPMSPEAARTLGYMSSFDGVIVRGIEPGSLAAQAQLRLNDVIVAVGRTEVATTDEFYQALAVADLDRGVRLSVVRDDRRGYVVVKRQE